MLKGLRFTLKFLMRSNLASSFDSRLNVLANPVDNFFVLNKYFRLFKKVLVQVKRFLQGFLCGDDDGGNIFAFIAH